MKISGGGAPHRGPESFRWRYVALSVGLGIVSPAVTHAESLQDALVRAYSTNAELLAERRQLESTNENVPQALSNWRPTVQVTAQAAINRQRDTQNCKVSPQPSACLDASFQTGSVPSTVTSYSNLEPNNYSLTIDQPLYRGGRTVAQTAQALSQVRAERAHLVAIEQTVFASVITDYLDVIVQNTFLDLGTNNEQVLREQLHATQIRYRLGELTHTDVRLAEAAYAQAIAQRHTTEGELNAAREAYQHDVGEPPLTLKAPTTLPPLPTSREEAISLAAAAAPGVIQAQYAQQAAEDGIDVIRGQLLPQVVLQLSATRTFDYSASPGLRLDELSGIAQASMPLYDGGAVYSQSRAAQKNVASLKNQVDEARRVAVQAASQAWDGLKANQLALRADLEAVKSNEFALAGLQEEEKVGTRTIQDVLIQQESLFQSYTTYVAAQYQELTLKFNLVQSVGQMTAKNLALPVDYYDPEAEFQNVRDKWIGFDTEP